MLRKSDPVFCFLSKLVYSFSAHLKGLPGKGHGERRVGRLAEAGSLGSLIYFCPQLTGQVSAAFLGRGWVLARFQVEQIFISCQVWFKV